VEEAAAELVSTRRSQKKTIELKGKFQKSSLNTGFKKSFGYSEKKIKGFPRCVELQDLPI
jgi:hypothetical protein